jgi:hypothetical protein
LKAIEVIDPEGSAPETGVTAVHVVGVVAVYRKLFVAFLAPKYQTVPV